MLMQSELPQSPPRDFRVLTFLQNLTAPVA